MTETKALDQLAKGLSRAQRDGLRYPEWWHCDRRVTLGMHRKGLIEQPDYKGNARYSPLGQSLRNHIQESEK